MGGSHVSTAVCSLDTYQLGRVISAPHPIDQTSDAFINFIAFCWAPGNEWVQPNTRREHCISWPLRLFSRNQPDDAQDSIPLRCEPVSSACSSFRMESRTDSLSQ